MPYQMSLCPKRKRVDLRPWSFFVVIPMRLLFELPRNEHPQLYVATYRESPAEKKQNLMNAFMFRKKKEKEEADRKFELEKIRVKAEADAKVKYEIEMKHKEEFESKLLA